MRQRDTESEFTASLISPHQQTPKSKPAACLSPHAHHHSHSHPSCSQTASSTTSSCPPQADTGYPQSGPPRSRTRSHNSSPRPPRGCATSIEADDAGCRRSLPRYRSSAVGRAFPSPCRCSWGASAKEPAMSWRCYPCWRRRYVETRRKCTSGYGSSGGSR